MLKVVITPWDTYKINMTSVQDSVNNDLDLIFHVATTSSTSCERVNLGTTEWIFQVP